MKESILTQTIDAYDPMKEKYDEVCKAVLRSRLILANILKAVVPEYEDCSIQDIADRYIEMNSISSSTPVGRNLTNAGGPEKPELIPEGQTEDSTLNEGTVYYDVKFHAVYPDGSDHRIGLVINVEAQNDYRPGYPIVTRSIYYTARLLSSQPEGLFHGMDYSRLEKVYSIWICLGKRIPKKEQYTITSYSIQQNHLVGKVSEMKNDYDLLTSVLIRLSEEENKGDVRILNLLQDLFSGRLTREEKKKRLRSYGVLQDNQLEKEIDIMCKLSYGIAEAAIEEGWDKGIKEGAEKTAREVAIRALKSGMTCEQVAGLIDREVETVRLWGEEEGIL